MRFRISLTPDLVASMPEPIKGEIMEQLPSQLDRDGRRIEQAEIRIAQARSEHAAFTRFLNDRTAHENGQRDAKEARRMKFDPMVAPQR